MTRPLAFFFRRTQLSGIVRAQLASAIPARCNPTGDVSQTVCIGVKMSPWLIYHDKLVHPDLMGDYYLDFIDHHTCLDWLSHWPSIKVIVCSRASLQFLTTRLPSHALTLIPQHHCNVERLRRPARPVRVVGYVGSDHAVAAHRDEVTRAVSSMGLTMRWCTDFKTRDDVVAAYRDLDLQFTYRDGMPDKLLWTKNPLKVLNAGSFGIPTVAKREPGYDLECDGAYAPVRTLAEALDTLRDLSVSPTRYQELADRAWTVSQAYHLDEIATQFRRLGDA